MVTFRIEAFYSTQTDEPQHVSLRAEVETLEKAREIAAQFPQSVKLRPTTLDKRNGMTVGYLYFNATLLANGVNGGRNEAGIKRYRSLRKAIARLGYATTYATTATNSYTTEADFEAAIK